MTAQEELTMLETAYTAIMDRGVNSYSVNGRQLTMLDVRWMTERIDILRATVNRGTNGMFNAARNRPPE